MTKRGKHGGFVSCWGLHLRDGLSLRIISIDMFKVTS